MCDACHDQQAFKPAPHFRHDTYYVLAGAHLEAACSACHLPRDQNESEMMIPGEPNGEDKARGNEAEEDVGVDVGALSDRAGRNGSHHHAE